MNGQSGDARCLTRRVYWHELCTDAAASRVHRLTRTHAVAASASLVHAAGGYKCDIDCKTEEGVMKITKKPAGRAQRPATTTTTTTTPAKASATAAADVDAAAAAAGATTDVTTVPASLHSSA